MSKRILTGMRTTGKLHLGHFVGALEQWKKLQDQNEYDCYFLLADVQALTTHIDQPELLSESVREVVLDWLAVGLDPEKTNVHFVLQSQVLERFAISGLLMMIAGYSELMHNPTLKSELKLQKHATMGFLSYPVDQAADIYMVSPTPPKDDDELLIPVGEDQVPHLEYARVLAERFNNRYGKVFVPCQPLVGRIGRLVGIDGQAKMSKSLDNAIYLSDDEKTVILKVKKMFTDPKRISADIPGETKNNPVFIYHRAFNPDKEEVVDLTKKYEEGKVGDVEVKEKLAKVINDFLEPIRQRRQEFARKDLREYVVKGTEDASKLSKPVLEAMMKHTSLSFPK